MRFEILTLFLFILIIFIATVPKAYGPSQKGLKDVGEFEKQ